MEIYKIDSRLFGTAFDIAKKKKRIAELEKEIENPDFWKNKDRAVKLSQEAADFKKEVEEFEELEVELELLKEVVDEKKISEFERKLKQKEFQVFLFGKYDKGNAILSIYSGAGGQDAQDWAAMLFRMYNRYCQSKGFKTKILHQSFGDPGGPEGRIGIKSASIEIKGSYAYGFLKKETGVHRLVRISPFSAQSLRHTSFALVEVLPEISEADEAGIKIKPEELKIEFYRASGPGGQYVNKRESAVRITHLPTGTIIVCQSERLQGENRKRAMQVLLSKLYQLQEEAHKEEMSKIKGDKISASWGNQIRSYVLHPYKMVKDLRTDFESLKPEDVLEGNLDNFIEAEIKIK